MGDEIVAANSLQAGVLPTAAFLRQIKGPEGTVVTLSVRRGDQRFDLRAVRSRLKDW